MKIGSLFSGYGGLDLAVESLFPGASPAWFCEVEPAPSKILAHHWPTVPNLGDIAAVDWAAVEPVDVLTGGFPCQDVSHAGRRRGLGPGTRSGLWARMADAIDHLRPALVVAENVRGLLSAEAASDVEPCPWCLGDAEGEPPLRALGAVLADLAELGYDAAWHGLSASDIGAPHGRFRVFVVAWPADSDPDSIGRGPHVGDVREGQSDAHRVAVPYAPDNGHERGGHAWRRGARPEDGRHAAADADGGRLERLGRLDTLGRDAHGCGGPDGAGSQAEPQAWGPYTGAVRRWELTLGRSAPSPTEPGAKGQPRLSPRFVEWMMGLDDGHVTGTPGITRNDMLRALGNGVVPQQGAEGIRRGLAVRDAVLDGAA